MFNLLIFLLDISVIFDILNYYCLSPPQVFSSIMFSTGQFWSISSHKLLVVHPVLWYVGFIYLTYIFCCFDFIVFPIFKRVLEGCKRDLNAYQKRWRFCYISFKCVRIWSPVCDSHLKCLNLVCFSFVQIVKFSDLWTSVHLLCDNFPCLCRLRLEEQAVQQQQQQQQQGEQEQDLESIGHQEVRTHETHSGPLSLLMLLDVD